LSIINADLLKRNSKVQIYLRRADKHLEGIGYTEHGIRHATITAKLSEKILHSLGRSDEEVRLAGVAGFLHDIGNVCGRVNHGQSGAIIAHSILAEIGMSSEEIVGIMEAIGNHEEEFGQPTSEISAALILADKSDVHRSRVRTPRFINFDIHDRVC
jgi:metal-dependent HD superfamily phosphatase/phosphodiesterase